MHIENLGKDLTDSRALIYVLGNLDGEKCPIAEAMGESSDRQRAEQMLLNAWDLGVADLVTKDDFIAGNPKVNTILVAEIFMTKHGL